MENIRNKKEIMAEENTHKSRCPECPVYDECMGNWLNYFAGKRNDE